MIHRRPLPNRRQHITRTVRIAVQRTLYLGVYDHKESPEVFLHVKKLDRSSELTGLNHLIARVMSLALQYGAPLAKVSDLLAGAKFAPCGPRSAQRCWSLLDLADTLLVKILRLPRVDHVPVTTEMNSSS